MRPRADTPTLRSPPLLAALACVLLACSDRGAESSPAGQEPKTVRHDFGEVPHGETRQHEFVLTPPLPELIPLGYENASCPCATGSFVTIGTDQVRRPVPGNPGKQHALRQGEKLVLVLTLDTRLKEAVDLPKTTVHGYAILAEASEKPRRHKLPIEFTYSIRAPVLVLPKPHINFGQLPRCRSYEQTLELRPHDPGQRIRFANVRTSAPGLKAELIEKDGKTLLRLAYTPEPGKDAVEYGVVVGTDLPNGYEVPIRVSGAIVPDIEVQPIDAIAFGQVDFRKPAVQSINLIDHDEKRDPGFVVTSVCDDRGVDSSQHFAARIEPIPGDPRGSRLFLEYRGGLTGRVFHGTVTVVKKNKDGPVTVIQYHGFHKGDS